MYKFHQIARRVHFDPEVFLGFGVFLFLLACVIALSTKPERITVFIALMFFILAFVFWGVGRLGKKSTRESCSTTCSEHEVEESGREFP